MNDPKTWEQAAGQAATDMIRDGFFSRVEPAAAAEQLRERILKVADLLPNAGTGKWDSVLRTKFETIGLIALAQCGVAHQSPATDLDDVLRLIAGKQNDYGHENIAAFGLSGIIVRLSDKVARIRNLTAHGRLPANEALFDSWQDLVGYSVIACMWLNGTFMLPLACDLADHTPVEMF